MVSRWWRHKNVLSTWVGAVEKTTLMNENLMWASALLLIRDFTKKITDNTHRKVNGIKTRFVNELRKRILNFRAGVSRQWSMKQIIKWKIGGGGQSSCFILLALRLISRFSRCFILMKSARVDDLVSMWSKRAEREKEFHRRPTLRWLNPPEFRIIT
jgi:hypothetical protein